VCVYKNVFIGMTNDWSQKCGS